MNVSLDIMMLYIVYYHFRTGSRKLRVLEWERDSLLGNETRWNYNLGMETIKKKTHCKNKRILCFKGTFLNLNEMRLHVMYVLLLLSKGFQIAL